MKCPVKPMIGWKIRKVSEKEFVPDDNGNITFSIELEPVPVNVIKKGAVIAGEGIKNAILHPIQTYNKVFKEKKEYPRDCKRDCKNKCGDEDGRGLL